MKRIFIIVVFLFSSCESLPMSALADTVPAGKLKPRLTRLHKGIIAEETSGNYYAYLIIASTVRNRLARGYDHGLSALKRKNLNKFVAVECAYALNEKNIDLKARANSAIYEVFVLGRDYANGATHYEHTGKYKKPWWAKKMKTIKVAFANTKQEITLYKK